MRLDRDASILEHIVSYCEQIELTVDRFGDSYDTFQTDAIYRNAAALCILQICELVGKLTEDFRDSHDAIPWRKIKAMRNIVAHSYGKPRIEMSEDLFEEIRRAKRENYEKIYSKGGIEGDSEAELREAFEKLYDRCLQDINEGDESSYIFKHHISRIEQQLSYYDRTYSWQDDKDQAVVDYIASMTDGYFCELTSKLFPGLKFPHRTYINER